MITRRNFLKLTISIGLGFVTAACDFPIKKKMLLTEEQQPIKIVPNKLPNSSAKYNNRAMEHVKALSAPSMQGREAGTLGETLAANYIEKELQKLRLKPLGKVGYQQVFTVPAARKLVVNNRVVFIRGDEHALRTPCTNLIAQLPGTENKSSILLCAHYDHIGIYNNQIYPGANDNASGVGCVLDIVNRFAQNKSLKSNLIIAFWSAEEMGFLGSKAFIKEPTYPIQNIKAVFNIDTVGNGKTGHFSYWSDNKNEAVKALQRAAGLTGASVKALPRNGHNSDQSSFAQIGIPSVTLLSNNWLQNNHSIKDTEHFVDDKQLKLASDVVYNAIKAID